MCGCVCAFLSFTWCRSSNNFRRHEGGILFVTFSRDSEDVYNEGKKGHKRLHQIYEQPPSKGPILSKTSALRPWPLALDPWPAPMPVLTSSQQYTCPTRTQNRCQPNLFAIIKITSNKVSRGRDYSEIVYMAIATHE